jgi:hypothetical protein
MWEGSFRRGFWEGWVWRGCWGSGVVGEEDGYYIGKLYGRGVVSNLSRVAPTNYRKE